MEDNPFTAVVITAAMAILLTFNFEVSTNDDDNNNYDKIVISENTQSRKCDM
ncbi:MAG TPA: hypothetical protein VH500_04520 [Nitrososphaeraceae archaeon]|jgi:hypothetical protein